MKRIRFLNNLIVGKSLKKKERFIKWKLRHGCGFARLYVLILPENNSSQLEIMNAIYLKQKYYKDNPPYIAGFASSYDEAVELVTNLAIMACEKRSNADIKTMILEKEYIQ